MESPRPTERTSSRVAGETRHFDRFSQGIAEITEARIWAGVHFLTADVQGQILGRNVVEYMAEHYFPAGRLTSKARRGLLPVLDCVDRTL